MWAICNVVTSNKTIPVGNSASCKTRALCWGCWKCQQWEVDRLICSFLEEQFSKELLLVVAVSLHWNKQDSFISDFIYFFYFFYFKKKYILLNQPSQKEETSWVLLKRGVKGKCGWALPECQRLLGVLCPEQRSWGEAWWRLQLLTGSGGAALSSALCDSDRARGNGMELCQGRGSWGLGTGAAPQGGGHGPRLPEFKECLDTALRHRVWILGGPVLSQGLDSAIPVGRF